MFFDKGCVQVYIGVLWYHGSEIKKYGGKNID